MFWRLRKLCFPPRPRLDPCPSLPRALMRLQVPAPMSSRPNAQGLHRVSHELHKRKLKLTWRRTEVLEYTLERGPAQTRDQYTQNHVIIDLPVLGLPFSRWTSVCTDDRFMNHLMALFWTWDNTVEPVLFRPLFEEDLCGSRATFCSPFLVNALLALSCVSASPYLHCVLQAHITVVHLRKCSVF